MYGGGPPGIRKAAVVFARVRPRDEMPPTPFTPAVECRLIARSVVRRAGFRLVGAWAVAGCVLALAGCASIRRANQIGGPTSAQVEAELAADSAATAEESTPLDAFPAESTAVVLAPPDSLTPSDTLTSVTGGAPDSSLVQAQGSSADVPPAPVSSDSMASLARADSVAAPDSSATDSTAAGSPAERVVYGPPVPANFKKPSSSLVPDFGLSSVLRRTPKLKIADLKGGTFLGISMPLYDHQPGLFEPPVPDSVTALRVLEMKDNPNYTPATTFDPTRGVMSQSQSFAGIPITYPYVRENHEYGAEQLQYALRSRWREKSLRYIENGESTWVDQHNAGGRRLRFEADLPPALTNIFGSGAHFDIYGSERIAIGGKSDFSKFTTNSFTRRSVFPSLNMRQDLQVQMGGSIGDKIKVDVDQRSNVTSEIENRIGITYKGYNEEVIQELNLGNTNLSLQGANYVSYGGQHQGLFGVRSLLKLGGVEITSIASKEQAKGNIITKTPERDKADPITVDQYIHGRIFFLTNPRDGAPQGDFAVDEASLKVYRGNPRSSSAARVGRAFLFPDDVNADTASVTSYFTELRPGLDFRIDPFYVGLPVIVLNEAMRDEQTLAVAYRLSDAARTAVGRTAAETPVGDTLRLKALRVPSPDARNPKDLASGEWAGLRIYENRSWYDLGTTDFKPEASGFRLNIFRVNGGGQDSYTLGGVPYVQLLGLDREDGTTDAQGNPTQRPDGRVDTRYFDTQHGYLRFPFGEWEPFWISDPDLATGPKPIDPLGDDVDPRIYLEDWSSAPRPQDYSPKYYFQAEGIGVVTRLELGRTDIREGSETIDVDGQVLSRTSDYNIDYTTGVVELVSARARKPEGKYTIAYSYNPLFAQTSNSVMGTSAKFGLGRVGAGGQKPHQMSATLLYEGRGGVSKLEHPKLEDAPSRTMVGDLMGSFQLKPGFLDRMVDALPLVRAGATPSQFRLESEVGVSAPNPNTRNLAYLDDMQITRKVNSVLPDFARWFWSGIPEAVEARSLSRQEAAERQAAFRWYNLPTDREVALTQAEVYADSLSQSEKTSAVNVLNWRIDPRGGTTATSPDPTKAWAGLTQLISTTGEDFSQWQYLDVYLRVADSLDVPKGPLDPAVLGRLDSLKLHIDFGLVSEDAEWQHGVAPDGLLQTEDRDHNNDFANSIEDTGLDTLWSVPEALARPGSGAAEPGISTENPDPSHDDYFFTTNDRPKYDFSRINGTENNHRLDSEDLNGNYTLNTSARYFEFTLNLGGQPARDEAEKYPELKNGFRLFQIPLGEAIARSSDGISRPSWQQVQHCRIWVEGADQPLTLQIVRLDVVGNTWLERPPQDIATSVTVRVASTKGAGSAGYEPPPGTLQRDPTSIDRGVLPENSLVLDFQNVKPRQTASAFRNLATDQNYVQYDSLEMWVRRPDLATFNDSSTFFFRLGADSVNYYEYRTRLGTGTSPGAWRALFIPLEMATRTKLEPEGFLTLPRDYAGRDSVVPYRLLPRAGSDIPDTLLVAGAPSLRRVKRMEIGVINRLDDLPTSGLLYVDEVRIGAVRRERGLARRAVLNGNISDIGSLGLSYSQKDANFLQIGGSEGSGNTDRSLSANTSLNADRFLPAAWGLRLPVTYQWTQNRSTPKFQPGSDTRYSNDLQRRFRATDGNTSTTIGYSKTPSHNGLLRYTLDAFSFNATQTSSYRIQTTGIDSTRGTGGYLKYAVRAGIPRAGGTGQLLLPVLPWGKIVGVAFPRLRTATLRYMPTEIGVDVQASSSHSVTYVRTLASALGDSDVVGDASRTHSKAATITGRVAFQPVDDLRNVALAVSSKRDLTQEIGRALPILGNSGREVLSSKSLSFDYQPGFLRKLGGSMGYTGSSGVNADLGLRQPGDTGDVFAVQNNRQLDFNGRLPMQWLFGRPRQTPKTLRQQAAQDTAKTSTAKGPSLNPVLGLRKLLSSVLTVNEAVTVSHTVQNSSSYDRVGSLPGLGYQLGFSTHADDLTHLSQYRVGSSRSVSDRASLRGTVFGMITVDGRYDLRDDEQVNNGIGLPSRTQTWPDIHGSIPALESKVKVLKKVFSTLSLESSYRKTSKHDYADASRNALQSVQDQTSWQPFVSLQGSFRGGTTMSFRSEHQNSITSYGASSGFDNTDTWAHSLEVRKQFDTQHGFPVPWGGRIKLRSPLNTSFSFTYNTSRQGNSLSPRLTDDTRKWNLLTTADYQVGQDVRTSFNLKVGRVTPRLDGNWRQTVELETSLEYIFQ